MWRETTHNPSQGGGVASRSNVAKQSGLPERSVALPGIGGRQRESSINDSHKILGRKGNKTTLSVKCGIKFLHKGGTKEREERLFLPNAYQVTAFLCFPPQTTGSGPWFANTRPTSESNMPIFLLFVNKNQTPRNAKIAAEAVASRLLQARANASDL